MQFDLEEVKRIIAEKYKWGPSTDWTNFHFKELSRDIEAITGDRLSEETLKRIFGKRKVNTENYQPQAFSQMALVKYIESFKSASCQTEENSVEKASRNSKMLKIALWSFACVGFFIVMRLVWTSGTQYGNYQFNCKNPRDIYPFTAMFEYDVSKISDSVFTDFGCGIETYLPPEKGKINYFYANTGSYNVQIYTRKKILGNLEIVAWANDWQGGYFPNSKPEKFVRFMNQSFYRQPDYFYATTEGLKSENIDLSRSYWTEYRYFAPFNKSLDELSFETRVLNNASTGSYACYDVGIVLQGESGKIDIKFTQPKCSRYARMKLSEKQMDGAFDDLSAFTIDMSDWLQIRMKTENKKFCVYLGNKLIFTERYTEPIGTLLGIRYYFYGSGKTDYIELKDSTGNVFYRNDFGHTVSIAEK